MRKFIANLMVCLMAASVGAAPADFFTTNRLGAGSSMASNTFEKVALGSDTLVLHSTNTPGRGVGMTVLAAPTEKATLSFGDTVASNRYSFQGDMAVPEFVLRSGTDRVFTVHSDGTLAVNAGTESNDAVTVGQVNATNAVQDARVTTIAVSNDAQQTVLGALQTSNGLHATAISTLQTSNTIHAAATAGLSATNTVQNTVLGTLQTSNALAGVASNWSYHVAKSNIVLNGNWLSGDGGNEGVSVRADGNVGIGTTNPATTLDVNGPATIRQALTITNTTVHGNMTFTNAGTYFDDLSFSVNNIKISGATDIVADPVYGTLDFDTDGTTNVASSDYAWFVAQMPHKKKLGSAIAPHLHFMQTNADQYVVGTV